MTSIDPVFLQFRLRQYFTQNQTSCGGAFDNAYHLKRIYALQEQNLEYK